MRNFWCQDNITYSIQVKYNNFILFLTYQMTTIVIRNSVLWVEALKIKNKKKDFEQFKAICLNAWISWIPGFRICPESISIYIPETREFIKQKINYTIKKTYSE